ncbi:MAG: hypothetical protein ACXWIU_00865 [Limisphaerales bacterium]
MSDLQAIEAALVRAVRRRRFQRAWVNLWRGVFIAALLWLVALVVYKLAPVPFSIVPIAGIAGLACVIAGFLYGWFHRPTIQQTARWLDEKQNLQQRLSTALEMAEGNRDENWRKLLISDAAKFIEKFDPRKLLPFHLPRISRWSLLILALCAGLGFVPEYRSKGYLEQKKDAEVIKAVGDKLVELTKQNLQRRTPVMEPVHKAVENVEKVGLQLSKNPITRTDALKDLAKVQEQLKSQMKEMAKSPAYKALERSARNESKGGNTLPDLQKKIDAMQKALGDKASADAMDKLNQKMQQAKAAAAAMPNDGSAKSQEAKAQMEKMLSDLNKEAKELGQQIPNLDAAIEALRKGETENFAKDMEAATTDLEKLKDMAKQLDSMQKEAAQMGKDLPQQLQRGQAEAAQQTLQKMIDQLKSGKLSKEDAQKMLDEVSRSVDPASPYGKAADFLKQATKEMQNGQKSDAAQSLANASKELQNAMEQMQDAQSMMASLDALNKAETAIASRKAFGTCPWCGKKGGR